MEDRRRAVQQLTRVLPRAEQLFAQPRQRVDVAAERLGHALRRNLGVNRRAFIAASSLLRPAGLKNRLSLGAERTRALALRLTRNQRTRLAEFAARLDGLSRVLDGVSHHAVLARGFALVRGGDGTLRRRAAAVIPGERLSLTFGDGVAPAVAGEGGHKPKSGVKKSGGNQGDLF
jgi:exodeoxyribonuclease VII large subunit